jgi:hypothetical protein
MTQNQIAYFKAKIDEAHYERSDAENRRHNLRTEDLTAEGNAIQNTHFIRSDTETGRHNTATEAIQNASVDVSRYNAETNRLNLYETVRHNQQNEELGWSSLAETSKHNRATEAIGTMQAVETIKHDRNAESLQNYANITNRYATVFEAEKDKAQAAKTGEEAEYLNATQGPRQKSAYEEAEIKGKERKYYTANQIFDWVGKGSQVVHNFAPLASLFGQ